MSACAIIQARMGSTRLPGKVLQDLAGKPMIARVAERARRIPGVDAVIIATPDGPADAPLRETVSRLPGVTLFAGSEHDVLDRYYRAALGAGAEFVLRATADCPFLDPEVAGRVLAALTAAGADFATNNQPPTFPHGLDVEAYRFTALSSAWSEAKDPIEREHVGPFVRSRPERFKAVHVRHSADLHGLRWTVDEPADLDFARALAEKLGPRVESAGFEEIAALLAREPKISSLNAHVQGAYVWDAVKEKWLPRA